MVQELGLVEGKGEINGAAWGRKEGKKIVTGVGV